MQKMKVEGIEIDFSSPLTTNPGVQIIARDHQKVLQLYTAKDDSFGTRLKNFFTDPELDIPERVDFVTMKIDSNFLRSVSLDKKLIGFVQMTGAEIVKWDANEYIPFQKGMTTAKSDLPTLNIKLRNVNPLELAACIASAIKENSNALGQKAALLGVKEVDKIPNISPVCQSELSKIASVKSAHKKKSMIDRNFRRKFRSILLTGTFIHLFSIGSL